MTDSGPSDPWHRLRRHTPARIALGRSGVSLPTSRHLEFQVAHAQARTAVHSVLDTASIRRALDQHFPATVEVQSQAADRATYLQRPDLGRQLSSASATKLGDLAGHADVVVTVCDGLSALAVEENAAPFLERFLPLLAREGLMLAPLVIATKARVALADHIGAAFGARLAIALIGERPGLTAADSMGLYLTYEPRQCRTDANRNCISNIRPGGLSYEDAAHRAHYLCAEALRRQLSGVALKDETSSAGVVKDRRHGRAQMVDTPVDRG